jgi:hypothetical protein
VKLVRFRRPKATYSPSYVDSRPKATAARYGTLVTLRGGMHRTDTTREGNLKLECG